MALVIPAYFGVGHQWTDATGAPRDAWKSIEAAGKSVRIVVAEASFPGLTESAKQVARDQFDRCHLNNGQMVLGYVSTRDETKLDDQGNPPPPGQPLRR